MSGENLKNAIKSAKKIKKSKVVLGKKSAYNEGLELLQNSNVCFLGTNSEAGYPNIKAMMNLKHEGLKEVWFSTNNSSKRVRQILKDGRACVYCVDEVNFKGLMLVGTIEVLQDIKSRKMLWTEGAEIYYPLGIEDPDYSVLCFSAKWGNYYHGLKNIDFDIE